MHNFLVSVLADEIHCLGFVLICRRKRSRNRRRKLKSLKLKRRVRLQKVYPQMLLLMSRPNLLMQRLNLQKLQPQWKMVSTVCCLPFGDISRTCLSFVAADEEEEDSKKKKGKKKKKGEKEKEEKEKKGKKKSQMVRSGNFFLCWGLASHDLFLVLSQVLAILEQQKKIQEAEEAARKELEEKERQAEEARRLREEKVRNPPSPWVLVYVMLLPPCWVLFFVFFRRD